MSYFLRKTNKEKGIYLQICETIYNPETKMSSNKNYKVLGYVDSLKQTIDDPISYYEKVVKEMNEKDKEERKQKVSSTTPIVKNIGYFLLKAMMNTLNVKDDLDLMGVRYKYEKSVSEFIETMIYCQIVKPSSKQKNASDVIPYLYKSVKMSDDQIYRMINFVGCNYKKYIELFNSHIEETYDRDYKHAFFDCTNYYFEIDLAKDDKQKGPSKENRKEPIIGQALLLDANQIPLCMEMYPGNKSERPYIRKLIEEMKIKNNILGKTIQVADKGLNCAQNIYFASVEGDDGYVFSKSIHGKNLNEKEKQWILLNDDTFNIWKEVKNHKGEVIYKYKECIDDFEYQFINENKEKIKFTRKEKRIVTFNENLAKKQINEINKQVEKIMALNTIKGIKRSEYGDAVKYVDFKVEGDDVDISPTINETKINEDKLYAGYNLIVTSETNLSAEEIYRIYHGLWKIEESFRITKSYLEARPVYLQTKESIYGHFLICYLSLLLLRLLEINVFKNSLNTYDLISFIRSFNITDLGNKFMSNILNTDTLKQIKSVTQLTCIDNLYLSHNNIKNMLEYEFLYTRF